MVNKWDKKYKAIAREVVEILAKHGLTVELAIWVLKLAMGAYTRAGEVKVPTPQEIHDLLT